MVNKDNKWWQGVMETNGNKICDEQCATTTCDVINVGNKQWRWMNMTTDFNKWWWPMTATNDDVEWRQRPMAINNNNDKKFWRRMATAYGGDVWWCRVTATNKSDKRRQRLVATTKDSHWQSLTATIDSDERWHRTKAVNYTAFVSGKLWLIIVFHVAIFNKFYYTIFNSSHLPSACSWNWKNKLYS